MQKTYLCGLFLFAELDFRYLAHLRALAFGTQRTLAQEQHVCGGKQDYIMLEKARSEELFL